MRRILVVGVVIAIFIVLGAMAMMFFGGEDDTDTATDVPATTAPTATVTAELETAPVVPAETATAPVTPPAILTSVAQATQIVLTQSAMATENSQFSATATAAAGGGQ